MDSENTKLDIDPIKEECIIAKCAAFFYNNCRGFDASLVSFVILSNLLLSIYYIELAFYPPLAWSKKFDPQINCLLAF